MDTSALHDILSPLLKGRVCILGVGNRLKGDDAAGCVLIDLVAGRVPANCLDVGVAPENYLEKVARLEPETILIVDAMDWGGAPGDVRVVDAGALDAGSPSTHALSLQMAAEYLSARSGAHLYVVGIQPAQTEFQEGLSTAVEQAVSGLAAAFCTPALWERQGEHQPRKTPG